MMAVLIANLETVVLEGVLLVAISVVYPQHFQPLKKQET